LESSTLPPDASPRTTAADLVPARVLKGLALLLALLVNLFLPWGIATTTRPLEVVLGAAATGAKVALLGVVLAIFEVFVAKLRLFRVPELLAASFVLAFLAVTASFFLT